jgi:hypothetical protein
MKTSDFPSVREARLTVEKHMERYKKLMGIKKGKTMIELPRLNSVSVMTSNVGSTHMTPREDYVRLSDATTYGDQRAAEARDQMREECIKACQAAAGRGWSYYEEERRPVLRGKALGADVCVERIKELP